MVIIKNTFKNLNTFVLYYYIKFIFDINGQVFFAYNKNQQLYINIEASGKDFDEQASRGGIIHNIGNLDSKLSQSTVFLSKGNTLDCNVNGVLGNFKSDSKKTLSGREIRGVNSYVGLLFTIYENPIDCSQPFHYEDLGEVLASCVVGIGNLNASGIPDNIKNLVDNTLPNGAANQSPTNDGKKSCSCRITPTSHGNAKINGTVYFENIDGSTTVTAKIYGLEAGSIHGMHLHSFGDLSSGDGASIGGHWKDSTQTHALPENSTRDNGDLPNLCTYRDSVAYFRWKTQYFPHLSENNMLGRSIAIHEKRDNGTAGSFGERIAWCVIGIANSQEASPISDIPSEIDFNNPLCPYAAQLTKPPTPTKEVFSEESLYSQSSILEITSTLSLIFLIHLFLF
ncbi:superoxide dismutase [Tieghemostelium lacteum]|uniref:Superoxide dismutase n=1 Tax=Tieghemostelium lacteum TaxID=361077 RepID=A0A151ZEF6_TIELA|nr:superoxide dismutase [Tieghemostelium lacteum]|eukprot:KYQ92299.1 superoxide dismutase [Tieghemostelium lacteum]